MTQTHITAVSYYNTLPFIYGIKHSGFLKNYTLSLDVPSECSKKLLSGEAEIGLIPVGSFIDFPHYQIISDLCIGAEGDVKSVVMLSNSPVAMISKIFLDSDSRTSVNLARILASKFWKISPAFVSNKGKDNNSLQLGEAIVLIGDKTFGLPQKYEYCYDLASEWIKFTGKPFVFAAWIAIKPIEPEFVINLNKALKWGIDHLAEVVQNSHNVHISIPELETYLSQNISYLLTNKKMQGMGLYLEYLNQLD